MAAISRSACRMGDRFLDRQSGPDGHQMAFVAGAIILNVLREELPDDL
ncbi:MAG TPA: hypothetical protein VGU61_03235 [Noviherbaspirillum sp.]|nr:hypothetical protein [Noviherbaspirillum sp.]HEV2609259.1 hypothetical protein [Noviherbaspirillum sp.]